MSQTKNVLLNEKKIRNIQIVFDVEIDFDPNFMIFEATESCVLSTWNISNEYFAMFDFLVKINLVLNVQSETPQL